ncbi:putative indole-3-pyruvate monooxygenase YUCCA11 [Leucoagaricus sp. SymC.cos]|nr:putative indole-3-pyruvate monooxygenase YUCCA11 [Leucoagaricus sp. SymC.cos]
MSLEETIHDTGVPLPTLDSLKAAIPPDLDTQYIARSWFNAFRESIGSRDLDRVCDDLLLSTAVWRDLLALTWDFRIFRSPAKLNDFLKKQLPIFNPRGFEIRDLSINLQRPYPDLAWIVLMFDFQTDVGICSGVARLVPTQSGDWKAYAVLTNLEDLRGFPEKIGPRRNFQPNHGLWEQQRRKELDFAGIDPAVLIIGGGQSGLIMAARLRALDVSVLVIEKNDRVGDNWGNRYDALCLHDPVWWDHMPYMPFPSTWPVFTPARKLAGWLEHYAESLEIPFWTAATVIGATQDKDNRWHVNVTRKNGFERRFVVNHLVFATGFGGGATKSYDYPGLNIFKGQYIHSTEHKRASDHIGKRVVIVGSGTSAHDIARDFCDHGIDVTMVQRGPTYVMSANPGWEFLNKGMYWEGTPPADTVDRIVAAFPRSVAIEFYQRRVKQLAELDKDILDGLRKVGFKLSEGALGCGVFISAITRSGGYYIDVGASRLIIDGKIKLKNDSTISQATETGLKFADGSELPADVVIFSTGLGDAREAIRKICGDAVAEKTKPLWGLNSEGEIHGDWRDTGVTNMWYAFCNLALCRFHSKHLALQIKAIEEGFFGQRYDD